MIDPIAFGRLQAEVDELRRGQEQSTAMLKGLAEDMAAVREQLSEARGGWKLMVALGGAAASMGGAISWVATHIKWSP